MSQNDELKRLAEAAPEGPWFGPEYAPGTSYVFDVDLGTLLHYESIDTEQDTCLRYVAAANPAAVLALIAENERLTGCIVQRRAQAEQYDQALIKMAAERDQLRAAISTPELVFVNMKAGRIAKISLRSAIDLHGEVINGDDAQQIEIAKLRAEVAGLRTGYEAYEQVNAELKAEVEKLRNAAAPLGPVNGDQLPAINSKVLIHLSSCDAWVEHTVVGYYAWEDLGANEYLHRVFVRVRDADGYLNARLLKDVRAVAALGQGEQS